MALIGGAILNVKSTGCQTVAARTWWTGEDALERLIERHSRETYASSPGRIIAEVVTFVI